MEYELEEIDWLQFPHGVSEWGNWAEEHLILSMDLIMVIFSPCLPS